MEPELGYKIVDQISDINIREIKEIKKQKGIDEFLKYQKERYKCPFCGGIIYFYCYKCGKCGKEINL